jgi:hypothetical protein
MSIPLGSLAESGMPVLQDVNQDAAIGAERGSHPESLRAILLGQSSPWCMIKVPQCRLSISEAEPESQIQQSLRNNLLPFQQHV